MRRLLCTAVSGVVIAVASPPMAQAAATRQVPRFLIVGTRSLNAQERGAVQSVRGVRAIEPADAGQILLNGRMTGILGVQPGTFRAYTPPATAMSDGLWTRIDAGDLAISFTTAAQDGYPLGRTVPVGTGPGTRQLRIGAYASAGIGDIGVIGSHRTVRALGITPDNALLVSAGDTPPGGLEAALRGALPSGTTLYPLDGPVAAAPLGGVMTARQIGTAIQAAAAKLGMPYVWGGESDQEGGYDCSGLVQYAFGQAGIAMPRTAEEQSHTGWLIPYEQAQPGDLLTWKGDPSSDRVTHVAIYLGDGQMIAAPHRGAVVQVQRVYFRHLWGAIRVDPQLAAQRAGH